MRLLLDTCAFLWWMAGSDKLSDRVRRVILDPRNDVILSAVSGWEIAIKHRLGRLELPAAPAAFMAEALAAHAVTVLPVGMTHAVEAGDLPLNHKDPFDRILVAQAIIETLPLATPDTAFSPYGIETVW